MSVSLVIPPQSPVYYLNWTSLLLGPMSYAGSPFSDTIDIDSPFDLLQQGTTNSYHERGVHHVKMSGWLHHQPHYLNATAAPTVNNPDCYRIGTTNYLKGFASEKCASRRNLYSGSYDYHYTMEWNANSIVVHTLQVTASRVVAYIREDITLKGRYSATQYKYDVFTTKYYPKTSLFFNYQPYYYESRGVAISYATLLAYANAAMGAREVTVTTSSKVNQLGTAVSLTTLTGPSIGAMKIWCGVMSAHLYSATRPEQYEFGRLAMEASATANVMQTNVLSFLLQVQNPKGVIQSFRNLAELRTAKAASDAYLGTKYGLLPDISDIQNIYHGLRSLLETSNSRSEKVYTAGHSQTLEDRDLCITRLQRIKLVTDNRDSGLNSLLNRLESVGVILDCKTIWDLLPFSFVIDWILDVGDFMERVDTHLRLERFGLLYTTMSIKDTMDFTVSDSLIFPYSGSIQLKEYSRWSSDHCPLPSLTSLNSQYQDFNHWLESAALLIQRKR